MRTKGQNSCVKTGMMLPQPRNYLKRSAGEAWKRPLPSTFMGSTALPAPLPQTSGLQNPEITHFWSPKVPSQWYLVIAAPGSIYILNNQALAQHVVV